MEGDARDTGARQQSFEACLDDSSAPAASATAENGRFPRPVKARWHPLRSGLLNLYRYDEEEFWFEQGRLLLRGNNGTGKSRVLALQLPFLLDGEIAPYRVEPDRDVAKRMEWNLLMNRHSDRLGYTWIEFGRRLPEGPDEFLTLGCGLRAVQGRGVDDRWYFVTARRVGRDLFLTTEGRNPIGRERLEEAVGREHIYRNARDYRRAVDEALFKLGPRYEPLIELLIRLRQPQLSRHLDETALSRALSEALPPLSVGLIEETAEAFRGLEADRDDLASVRGTQVAVSDFLTEYRRYVRTAARRRAETVRVAHSAYEAAARRMREAAERRDEAAEACSRLKDEMSTNEEEQAALIAEIRALEYSPEMRDARELDVARREADRCERDRSDAEGEAGRALAAENSARDENEQLVAMAGVVATESRRILAEAARRAEVARFAESHGGGIGDLTEMIASADRIETARRFLDHAVERRDSEIRHLRELQKLFVAAAKKLDEADRHLEEASNALAAEREAEQAARRALADAAQQLLSEFDGWRRRARHLMVAEPESLADEFQAWADGGDNENPLQAAAEAARRDADLIVAREEERLHLRDLVLGNDIAAIEAEIERLESGFHFPPPAPYTRATLRDDRAGAPLWKLCDFRSGTPPALRAGFEAALEASGLLDAWVQADGVLVDPATQDTILDPGDGGGTTKVHQTLDRWLEPRTSPSDLAAAAVSGDAVSQVLAAIGAERDGGDHWVAEDGSWRMGPLRGRWSKADAEHIGEASRAEARRRRVAALREERARFQREREELHSRLRELAARAGAIAAEFAALPSDGEVRQASYSVGRSAGQVATALERLEAAEQAAKEARATRDGARRIRDEDAADLGLFEWVERLDELRDAFAAYRESLSPVWPQLHRSLDVAVQCRRSAERLESAATERGARATRHREAELAARASRSRFLTLEASVGATAQAITERHASSVRRLDETRRTQQSLAEEEREHDLERARAAADIERHLADRARHEQDRDAAIERLAAFARQRLLAESDPEFADLDVAAEWTATRGVDVARRAESLLSDTPSGDDSWRRQQESIHQHTTGLRDQLIPRGHQLEEHLLEDGVVVVRCPFQGRACTMTELAATLVEDLAARTRLLDEKEREVIENHLLGEVVLELQKLVLEAEKWVRATNEQLASRLTSTGMRLRFLWEADPEGPVGLDVVHRQLLRTRDLWTPEERRGLAEFLQSRIREARDRDDAGTWRDFLAAALDYRQWHRFVIERHQEDQWRRLTRRTYGTGSGGEKALALTLPQFAAAAAHYQSADPAAPRLILLDEAFVGIDSDMRAKCMGLLDSFDLDFVMTSEREWGCYPTLPGLAIYQLSSRPGIDAVVCTRWVWNGHERERLPSAPIRRAPPRRRDSSEAEAQSHLDLQVQTSSEST